MTKYCVVSYIYLFFLSYLDNPVSQEVIEYSNGNSQAFYRQQNYPFQQDYQPHYDYQAQYDYQAHYDYQPQYDYQQISPSYEFYSTEQQQNSYPQYEHQNIPPHEHVDDEEQQKLFSPGVSKAFEFLSEFVQLFSPDATDVISGYFGVLSLKKL